MRDVVEEHSDMGERVKGRTLIELSRANGEWEASQLDVDLIGTGGTATGAVIDYCQKIQDRTNENR